MNPCSYCGRENEASASECRECGTELLPVPSSDAAKEIPPSLPKPHLIDAGALALAFSYADGFHRADWEFIGDWIVSHVAPSDSEAAWNEAVLLWVTKLRDDLGGSAFVLCSKQTVLLCDLPLDQACRLLDVAGKTEGTIRKHLGKTAWRGAFGRDVALIFSDQDDYYQYLSHHTPDGEQAGSGGVCINSGYTHIAVPWHDEIDAINAIVHELTHDCLAHLPLPSWLNEGVAVTLQRAIAPPERGIWQGEQDVMFSTAINWQPPIMWDELAERHFTFWNEENIQSFWAGTSFHQPGDANELSYSLAQVFVKLLTEHGNGEAMSAFLESATQEDAGQTAAMDCLGVDLGVIAETFLGKGNWRPQRAAMVACWSEAGWREKGGEDRESGQS